MQLFSTFRTAKDRLTKIGKHEPLSFFSIVLIIALDIFVLVNLFQGLALQSSQLRQPNEVIPYECTNLIRIDDENRTRFQYEADLVTAVLDRSRNYYADGQYKYGSDFINESRNKAIDTACRAIFDAATALKDDSAVANLDLQLSGKQTNLRSLENTIRQREQDYDTMLLERIAGQEANESIITGRADDVRSEIDGLEAQKDNTEASIAAIQAEIIATNVAQSLIAAVDNNRQTIEDLDDSLRFWYPLKKFTFEFLFLVPLLIFFFWLHRRSVAKKNELLVLVSAHLLVVVMIPVIIRIFNLLLNILPFHFLADIFHLLEELGLVTLWNYLLIFIAIGITIGLIYFVQKKLFNRERLYLKRISQKQCTSCGTRLDAEHRYCYKCGAQQLVECAKCHQLTFAEGLHCTHCGTDAFRSTKEQ